MKGSMPGTAHHTFMQGLLSTVQSYCILLGSKAKSSKGLKIKIQHVFAPEQRPPLGAGAEVKSKPHSAWAKSWYVVG